MKILISGFEPFGGMSSNPSQELLEHLQPPAGLELRTVLLPVSFERSFLPLARELEVFQPQVVIGTGLAASRSEITVERVAINLIEARIADNDGSQPTNQKIDSALEDGIFSSLPLGSMVAACRSRGIPASISNSAGTYVCNYLMYKIVSEGRRRGFQGGFVHLPPVHLSDPEQGLTMDNVVEAFHAMLEAIQHPQPATINSGRED